MDYYYGGNYYTDDAKNAKNDDNKWVVRASVRACIR
jgi:hypothetical protein